MHPHLKTNLYIVLLGLLFGIVSGFSIFLIKSKTHNLSNSSQPTAIESEIHISPEPTPTPADFCLRVPILTYHHIQPFDIAEPKNQRDLTVSPENFARHMQSLKENGYSFVSLDDLVNALKNEEPLPEKSIVITLDDAYRDGYTYAFPIAKQYGVILNVGVITSLVGHEEHVTASQIQAMEQSGYAKFYNHTWSHRNLKSSDEVMIRQQIEVATDQLAQWSHSETSVLFYPYGVYGPTVHAILKELQFDGAVSLVFNDKNTQHCASKIYELSRLRVGNGGPEAYNL